MLSARASSSSGDSPAGKAADSSARRARALNSSPHFPQRTWPPAARSTSADNLKTVSHFEHCVYTVRRLSERRCSTTHRVQRLAPYQMRRRTRPLPRRPAFSTGPTGPSILRARRPASGSAPIRSTGRQECWPARNRPAAMRRQRPRRSASTPCTSMPRRRRCELHCRGWRASACGSRSTAVTCAAPSLSAAMPRMPEPQP